MQENTESEKPEEPEIPENQEEGSDKEITSESTDSLDPDPSFEEQEGEVLPPEKKKGSGCGIFLFFLLVLGGGGGYLFYSDQVPPQIVQWVKPYYETAHQKLFGTSAPQEQAKIKPIPVPSPSEKWTSQVEEESQALTIQEKLPIFEEKVEVIPTPSVQEPASNEEHISGSQTEPRSVVEEVESDYPAEISGNSTFIEPESPTWVEEPKVEIAPEEPIELKPAEEKFIEPVPAVKAPPFLYVEKTSENLTEEPPQQKERDEAVQAYLDFFESTLEKIGELIKTGFAKGKDYLMKSLS